MESEWWVSGPGGLSGPRHLVEQAERQIKSELAAAEEGLPQADDQSPLITVLLLTALLQQIKPGIKRMMDSFRYGARQTKPRSPFAEFVERR